jgi:signal-transduction protein with cAMP-binding, CBS, and nucleotidyltransferase domain
MEIIEASGVLEAFGLPYFRQLSTLGALSDEAIVSLLQHGTVRRYEQGDFVSRLDQGASEFQIVLEGRIAYYKHFEGRDVLTRHFSKGEQMGFDLMIGLIHYNGTDVAVENTTLLEISSAQFYNFHVNFPADFGLLTISLARELAREIAMLEDLLGRGTGWELK